MNTKEAAISEIAKLKRGWWHETAKQMKRDGACMADIAAEFGVTYGAVCTALREVPSANINRARGYVKKVDGFPIGTKIRVAISFTDEQVEYINKFAADNRISFSFAASKLIDVARTA